MNQKFNPKAQSRAVGSGSILDHQFQRSVDLQGFDLNLFTGALEPQIGASLADSEAPNLDLIDEFGKDRADDAQSVFVAFRLEPQQGREQIGYCPGGPSLRLASDRVRNRNAVIVTMESAEQFRQPASGEMHRRFNQSYEDA